MLWYIYMCIMSPRANPHCQERSATRRRARKGGAPLPFSATSWDGRMTIYVHKLPFNGVADY